MNTALRISAADVLNERPDGVVGKMPSFPMDTLPPLVAALIDQVNKADGLHKDALAVSAVFAGSTGLGGTYRARLSDTHVEGGQLWTCLVQPSSTGKTPAQKVMFTPLVRYNSGKMLAYRDAVKMRKATADEGAGDVPPEGLVLHHDITTEAIKERLEQRPQGIGIVKDELFDLLSNMGRYTNGNDAPFYLQAWSGGSMSTARKGKPTGWVDNAFFSMAAGMQPALLRELPKKRDGFLPRWLWLFPDTVRCPRRSDGTVRVDPDVLIAYDAAIMRLLKLGDDASGAGPFTATLIDFAPDARAVLDAYNAELMDRADSVQGSPEQEMIGKLDTYSVRLALVLEFLWWACKDVTMGTNGPPQAIGVEAVERSIRLVEFFRRQGEKVMSAVYGNDPTANMNEREKLVFLDMPFGVEFKRSDFVAVAMRHDMTGGTVDRFLKQREIFVNTRPGHYIRKA
jgi:hypothetical protein